MTGPFKIPVILLAASMFTLGAYAQAQPQPQKQQKPPRFQVQVGSGGQNSSRFHVGDWLRQFRGKSFDQQKKSLESDPEYQKLQPQQQERLKDKLLKFNSLPPQQQEQILKRADKFERMTPQQRAQARAIGDRMRLMPEERRVMVRQQIHSLAQAGPEQRQKLLASDQFNRQFSPDERDVIQRALELNDAIPSPGEDESAAPR